MQDFDPDSEISPEEMAIVNNLSDFQIKEIDIELLNCCSARWQKMAKIIATMMSKNPSTVQRMSDVFYASRVRMLIEIGKLESKGYPDRMRYCEVRLTDRDET